MPDEPLYIPGQPDEDGWPVGRTEEEAHLGCAGRGYATEDEPFEDELAPDFHFD